MVELDKLDKEMDYAYTIQIEMLNYGNYTDRFLANFVSGITLFIIPTPVRDNYRLTAKVIDKEGKEIKTYLLEDRADTWRQLLLVFAAPFLRRSNVTEAVMSNMLMNLYQQIENDKVLYAN